MRLRRSATCFLLNLQVSSASVLAGIGYFIATLLITTCLMIPVARATFSANQAEGDFRYLHARVREFSESITFINGQANELKKAEGVFNVYYWQTRVLFRRQFFLNAFTAFQQSVLQTFGILLVVIAIRCVPPPPLRGAGWLSTIAP
jgi:ABC-type uncharacterized transport system fused permease/ATPase subunit